MKSRNLAKTRLAGRCFNGHFLTVIGWCRPKRSQPKKDMFGLASSVKNLGELNLFDFVPIYPSCSSEFTFVCASLFSLPFCALGLPRGPPSIRQQMKGTHGASTNVTFHRCEVHPEKSPGLGEKIWGFDAHQVL